MAEAKAVTVAPFGIEAVHPRFCDLLLQSIPGCRLRSQIGAVITNVDGTVRTLQSRGQTPPSVPGMRLHVNPQKRTYVIEDPLNEDEEAKSRIRKYMRSTTGSSPDNLKGADTVKGELDAHRMKTLCREVCDLLDEGSVKVIAGERPDREDIEELPGKFLLNPGLRTQSSQPMFEEDYEGWVTQLTRSGG